MDIYKEWEFISSIPKNVKPCFNDKTFVGANEWFVTIKRRYKGEKGENGIIYIENLIENTRNFFKNDKKLIELLQKSILGLKNLCETYKKDGQIEVSENYGKCIFKLENMILELGKKKNFFCHVPKLISD